MQLLTSIVNILLLGAIHNCQQFHENTNGPNHMGKIR